MGIQEKLLQDMKDAMKSGDRLRLDTIRVLRAMLKDAQIAKQAELEEPEVIQVLQSAAKKRREAIELYRQGGRQDLVEKEQRELEIIESYLPQMMSADEVERYLDGVIARVGAVGLRDLGKVMAEAMRELRGRADGKLVQEIARRKLS
ncbi:MAG: GatB/YqeY domain-containing protein [candidate division KSB1 bacterium]|nr:GatB/YqeY domain-containing protein [candidate division KSB1 bacterium]